DAADLKADADLAQLRVARLLDVVLVRAEHVVEATDAGPVVRARRAPVIADRLRGLHGLAGLIFGAGEEIAERPIVLLVVDLVAVRVAEERVDIHLLILEILGERQPPERLRVAEQIVGPRRAGRVAHDGEHAPAGDGQTPRRVDDAAGGLAVDRAGDR